MTEKKAADKADEKKSGSNEGADRVIVPNHDSDTEIVESIIEPASQPRVTEGQPEQRAHVRE